MLRPCDRCGKGSYEADIKEEEESITAGYYRGWTEFTNPGELIVCDACMHADPRYIAVYGKRFPCLS